MWRHSGVRIGILQAGIISHIGDQSWLHCLVTSDSDLTLLPGHLLLQEAQFATVNFIEFTN